MKGNKIAKRYALALFSLAKNDAELEKLKMDINFIEGICKNRDFRAMLGSPVMRAEIKRNIFKEIFEGAVNAQTILYLNMLLENHREGMLTDICYSFHDLYNSHKHIVNAFVTSAVQLNDAEKSKIIQLVKEATKCDVILNETINEALIGGFVLRYGDTQIDNSVSTQLLKVKQQLTQRIQ
ncbi:MAG: ATP synthase F1 subunit delta [Bacteroidota bacterium]|jgi:F-type H+-transporting ATPase subunit delta